MWANSKPDNLGTNYTIVITQSPGALESSRAELLDAIQSNALLGMCPEPQSHFWLIHLLPILWSFSDLAIFGLCAIWTNPSRAFLWGCYSLPGYLSLCLCYGHCCLVISHGIKIPWIWNQSFGTKIPWIWQIYASCESTESHPFHGITKYFFALHPNGQKFSLQGHLPSHARGPSTIQTRVQDSLLSLIDPWISIPLELGDKASPHLKLGFFNNIAESILTYPRISIWSSWSFKAWLFCWDSCIVNLIGLLHPMETESFISWFDV